MKKILLFSALLLSASVLLAPSARMDEGGPYIYVYATSLSGVKCNPNTRALWIIKSGGSAGVYRCSAANTFTVVGAATSPGGSTTQVQYNNAGAFAGISGATTDGTTLSLTSPKVTTGINDANGNSMLLFSPTGSAVNQVTVTNGASTTGPTLSATGTGTNLDFNVVAKGTGKVLLTSATNAVSVQNGITDIGGSGGQPVLLRGRFTWRARLRATPASCSTITTPTNS
jgi:hypothetical protein